MNKWPEEVPLLEASDIHRGDLHGPYGTHCIAGWTQEVFGKWPPEDVRSRVTEAFEEVMLEATGDAHDYPGRFNNDERVPIGFVARVWNRMMHILGYTVGNPEKKPLKKVF